MCQNVHRSFMCIRQKRNEKGRRLLGFCVCARARAHTHTVFTSKEKEKVLGGKYVASRLANYAFIFSFSLSLKSYILEISFVFSIVIPFWHSYKIIFTFVLFYFPFFPFFSFFSFYYLLPLNLSKIDVNK